MFTRYARDAKDMRGHCSMCNKNCRQEDASHRRCRNCLEIMCDECHDNMDQTPEIRQEVLQKRVKSTPEHWCFTKKPFLSIETSSSDDCFCRVRFVDWKKLEDWLGNNFGFWAYDRREFLITQEERVNNAVAAEREPQSDEVDWG